MRIRSRLFLSACVLIGSACASTTGAVPATGSDRPVASTASPAAVTATRSPAVAAPISPPRITARFTDQTTQDGRNSFFSVTFSGYALGTSVIWESYAIEGADSGVLNNNLGTLRTDPQEFKPGALPRRRLTLTFVLNGERVVVPLAAEAAASGSPGLTTSALASPAPTTPAPVSTVPPAPAATAAVARPAGPSVLARPATVKPGDAFQVVFSGFAIPVTVVHKERVMPDGRAIPLGNTHSWPGPFDTWWIDTIIGAAGEPWPSGRYVDRFVVNGVVFEAAVMVATPPGAAMTAPQVSATVAKDGANDLVTFKVVGFPPLTNVLYRSRVEPDGRASAVNEAFVTSGFTFFARYAYTPTWVRGTYLHRFVIEGKTYEVAVTLQ